MCLPTRLISQQSGSKHHRSRSVHPFGRPFVYFVRRSLTGSQLRLPSGGRRGAQLKAGATGSEQAPPLRRHRRGRGPSAVHRTAPPATWGGWAWDWPAGSASHRALLRTELVLRARAQLAHSELLVSPLPPPSAGRAQSAVARSRPTTRHHVPPPPVVSSGRRRMLHRRRRWHLNQTSSSSGRSASTIPSHPTRPGSHAAGESAASDRARSSSQSGRRRTTTRSRPHSTRRCSPNSSRRCAPSTCRLGRM